MIVIDIARSSSFAWNNAAVTRAARAAADVERVQQIRAIHADDNTYDGQPAGSRRPQQSTDTGCVIETTNGLPCQPELADDHSDSHAFVLESCDRFESQFRAGGEYRTLLTSRMYLFGGHPQLLRRGAFDRRFRLPPVSEAGPVARSWSPYPARPPGSESSVVADPGEVLRANDSVVRLRRGLLPWPGRYARAECAGFPQRVATTVRRLCRAQYVVALRGCGPSGIATV